LTLGKQPKAEHCLIIEKVPVMMAWLPTTAASIAIAKTGHLIFSGPKRSVFKISQYQSKRKIGLIILEIIIICTYQVQRHRIQSDNEFQYYDA
jgi:hypothetical protein